MRTFQEWAEKKTDLFEMANILTPEGESGKWDLQGVELNGPGVVNILKKLGGKAGINDLATELVKSSTIKIKNGEGDFKSLETFAKDNKEDVEKLTKYIVGLQKDQLRKQKGRTSTWKDRIVVVDNTWTLTDKAEEPKKTGGKEKDDYVPAMFKKGEEKKEEPEAETKPKRTRKKPEAAKEAKEE